MEVGGDGGRAPTRAGVVAASMSFADGGVVGVIRKGAKDQSYSKMSVLGVASAEAYPEAVFAEGAMNEGRFLRGNKPRMQRTAEMQMQR